MWRKVLGASSFCKIDVEQNGGRPLILGPDREGNTAALFDEAGNSLLSLPLPPGQPCGMLMAVKFLDYPATGLLAGLFEDGSLLTWNSRGARVLQQCKAHTESGICMDFSSSRSLILTGGADNHISLTTCPSTETPSDAAAAAASPSHTIELSTAGLNAISAREDGKLFVTGGWDGRITYYSLKKHTVLAVLHEHTTAVLALAHSPSLPTYGRLLAAGAKDGRVSLWNLYSDR